MENRILSCPFLGSNLDFPHSLVAISTELSRFLGFVIIPINFRQTTGTKVLLAISELRHSGKSVDGNLVRYFSLNARSIYSSKAKNEH